MGHHVMPGSAGGRALAGAGLALACGLAAAGCASAKGATLDSALGKQSSVTTSAPLTTVPTGGVADSCPTGVATVTVAGQASVSGIPDEVSVELGVQTQAKSAAVAMTENATLSNALVHKLENAGVAGSRIQTSQYSVQPVYNSSGSVITGYQVVNSVTVTLYDVGATGRIIDDAAAVAGNAIQVSDINFSLRSETALLGDARAAAIRQAAQQASLMASASGSRLGPVCSLTDNSSQTVVPNSVVPAAASRAAQTPVEAGTLQVTANVTAVYQLQS